MPTPRRAVAAVLLLLLLVAPSTALADLATRSPADLLRPEWTVERTRAGRAHVVGYLYNDNGVRNAANVWLRVEQVTTTGTVGEVYRRRIVGDVLSRDRVSFDVPVADADPAATYRVIVESADWFMECR